MIRYEIFTVLNVTREKNNLTIQTNSVVLFLITLILLLFPFTLLLLFYFIPTIFYIGLFFTCIGYLFNKQTACFLNKFCDFEESKLLQEDKYQEDSEEEESIFAKESEEESIFSKEKVEYTPSETGATTGEAETVVDDTVVDDSVVEVNDTVVEVKNKLNNHNGSLEEHVDTETKESTSLVSGGVMVEKKLTSTEDKVNEDVVNEYGNGDLTKKKSKFMNFLEKKNKKYMLIKTNES